MSSQKAVDLRDSLTQLHDFGLIASCKQIDEDAYTVASSLPWAAVAQQMSTHVKGAWWPSRRGCTVKNGGSRACYLIDKDDVDEIQEARAILFDMDLSASWTFGGMSRILYNHVGLKSAPENGARNIVGSVRFGYHDCNPGLYPDCTLFDVSSCYYQMLKRMKTLNVSCVGERLIWHPGDGGQWARWQEVLAAVAQHKLLRNSLWGAGLGSLKRTPRMYYRDGFERCLRFGRGPLHCAAALIGRSAWEMCREASEETSSVYSATDCVITNSLPPVVWRKFGLDVRIKAKGETHILQQGNYRVGTGKDAEIKFLYRTGSRFRQFEPLLPAPPHLFYQMWL